MGNASIIKTMHTHNDTVYTMCINLPDSPTFFFVTKAGGGTLERRGDPGNEANIIHQSQSITVFGYYMQVKVIVSKGKGKKQQLQIR